MVENYAMSKACEICNGEYLIDSKYCPTCGSKNEEYTILNQINKIKEDVKNSKYYNIISTEEISRLVDVTPYDAETEPEEKICPNCGFKNIPDYQFCKECGTKLTDGEEKIICQHCGTIANEEDNFCAECGQKL